jgi:hypothetical protein
VCCLSAVGTPESLTNEDGLIVNKKTKRDILLLLNEDLWQGTAVIVAKQLHRLFA